MLFTPCVPCFTGLNLSEVIPDEPAVLQELEDRVLDRLLRKVREEAGSEEPGELKYIDTASMGKKLGPGQGQVLCGNLTKCAGVRLVLQPAETPPKIGHTVAAAGWWQWV